LNSYPVPGRRLAPQSLGNFLRAPVPGHLAVDDLLHSLELADLDEAVWDLYSEEMCQDLAQAIREHVSVLVKQHDETLLSLALPVAPPGTSLEDLGLSPRAYQRLRRVHYDPGKSSTSPLTVEQALSIRHFGVTSLLELLIGLEQSLGEAHNHDFPSSIHIVDQPQAESSSYPPELAASIKDLLTSIMSIADPETLTLTDPRLGARLQAILISSQLAGSSFAEIANHIENQLSHGDINDLTSLHYELSKFRIALEEMCQLTLEDELTALLTAVTSERSRNIFSQRYGWDGNGGATLQEIGDRFSLSRERVRQVCKRVLDSLEKSEIYVPVLDRCLRFAAKRAPISIDDLERELLNHGIIGIPFRFEGVLEATNVLGREPGFRLVDRDHHRVIVTDSAAWDRKLNSFARKLVGKYGATTLEQVVDLTEAELEDQLDRSAAQRLLTGRGDFEWLDESTGWFWLTSIPDGRNRLVNHIRKILSVAEAVSVGELRTGVSRHHRSGGIAPPRRVLLEVCRQLPWCQVMDGMISAEPTLDWKEVLGDVEQILVSTLLENAGVMSRENFEAACTQAGVARSTFYVYLGYSPIIVRHARGVYGLQGASVEPGLVDSLRPKPRGRGVLQDYGWSSSQQVWIAYRVSAAMTMNGMVSIPSALSEYLEGEYIATAADDSITGRFVCQGNSGWGLRPVLDQLGAEADDILLLTVDAANKRATVRIGDESMLENFQEP
jgi:hypothetical protein